MKVAILNTFSFRMGGVWNYANNLAKILADNGFYITVFRPIGHPDNEIFEKENKNNFLIKHIDVFNNKNYFKKIILKSDHKNKKLLKIIKIFRKIMPYDFIKNEEKRLKLFFRPFDIIHFPSNIWPLVTMNLDKPIVMNPHDFQHEYFPEFFSREALNFRRNVSYKHLKNAEMLITHGEHVYDDVLKYLQINPEYVINANYGNFEMINNTSLGEDKNLLANLQLPEKYFFYPAKSWWHKNHLRLIEAIYKLKTQGTKVNCIFTDIIGDTGEEIHHKIELLKLKDQIIVVGRVSLDIIRLLYKHCIAVVVPSLFEQQSGPVLEGIAMGKAVLASDIASHKAIINDAGLVFNPFSVTDIAEKILKVFSNDALKRKFEKNASVCASLLTWDEFINNHKQAYQQAIINRKQKDF